VSELLVTIAIEALSALALAALAAALRRWAPRAAGLGATA
jgi:hypothetical protein